MINTNSIWIGKDDSMQIDIRSHFLGRQGLVEGSELTGNILLRADTEWHQSDRLVEVSGRRYAHTEKILKSVADCLVDSLLVEATAQGVSVNSVKATVEGACEPLTRPGVVSRLRSGPPRLDIVLRVVADASEETIGRLVVAARRTSPAFDLVATGVKVEVSRYDG